MTGEVQSVLERTWAVQPATRLGCTALLLASSAQATSPHNTSLFKRQEIKLSTGENDATKARTP